MHRPPAPSLVGRPSLPPRSRVPVRARARGDPAGCRRVLASVRVRVLVVVPEPRVPGTTRSPPAREWASPVIALRAGGAPVELLVQVRASVCRVRAAARDRVAVPVCLPDWSGKYWSRWTRRWPWSRWIPWRRFRRWLRRRTSRSRRRWSRWSRWSRHPGCLWPWWFPSWSQVPQAAQARVRRDAGAAGRRCARPQGQW